MTLKTGNKGFTFIELMVTAAVLSLGIVMIQGGLLRAADILNRYSNTLIAAQWMDEKLWQTQEEILYLETGSQGGSGRFTQSGRDFDWNLESETAGIDTIKIKLLVSWNQGGRPVQLIKEIYAAK